MFSTELAKTITSKESSFMDAGIHDNIALVSYRLEKSPNGIDFIEFTYQNDLGQQLKQTEYAPSKFANQTDDEFKVSVAKKLKKIMDIVECFYTKGTQNFDAATYYDFCNWVVGLLDKADKTIKLRVKAVYQPNGYVSVPKQAQYTYIERMDVEKTAIAKLSIDLFERPIVADKEETKANGLETFTSGNTTIVNGNITIESDTSMPF